MIRLVVNGDDFGLTAAVSQGILRAHHEGILTSCSILGNCSQFSEVVSMLRHEHGLGKGVHLTVFGGSPVLDPHSVPSLVGRDGRFAESLSSLVTRAWGFRFADLFDEFNAQTCRVIENGIQIDHVDTHLHLDHIPILGDVVRAIATKFLVSARRRLYDYLPFSVDRFSRHIVAAAMRSFDQPPRSCPNAARSWGFIDSGRLNESRLSRILHSLTPGCHEIICHPGEADPDDTSDRRRRRYRPAVELAALTSTTIRDLVHTRKIALCRWCDLGAMS